MLGFREHVDRNPHLHAVMSASKKEWAWLLNKGKDFWLQKQKRGQMDFSKIKSREKMISYLTKEFSALNSQERMFVYKAPLAG